MLQSGLWNTRSGLRGHNQEGMCAHALLHRGELEGWLWGHSADPALGAGLGLVVAASLT